MIVTTIHPGRN